MDRDGVCAGRYRAVRSVEEYLSLSSHADFSLWMLYSLGSLSVVICWISEKVRDDGPAFPYREAEV